MTTFCDILRTNRTMAHIKVKDKENDFKFEGGLYFIRREKVFLDKTKIRGKIKPKLLFLEGVSDPLYIDNIKLMEYYDEVPIFDDNNNPIIDIKTKKQITERKKIFKLEDIFIDSRAIHNMTDKKILDVLSSNPDFGLKEYLIFLLFGIVIIIGIINIIVAAG